jgi:lipopolysaccharide transport system ATP-binding protein
VTDLAVRAAHLAKRYRIGAQQAAGAGSFPTLRDSIGQALRAPLRLMPLHPGGRRPEAVSAATELWALRDVSFDVQHGQVLGIIGRNGAGKSTLLKILSRITEPTSGQAELAGRVGSLLEVGTGFHPELTGRENIYLSGAILGMPRADIRQRFDEIVAFAEVKRFLDTPVKRYSSGMYTRLAFSVAAHLDPDILVVDEVLAVGDAAFQRKCLGKMGDAAREGRTILFVSHNMAAVQSLCDRALWLRDGRVVEQGAADVVVSRYLRSESTSATQRVWPDLQTAPGNEHVRLHLASARPADTASTPTPTPTPTPTITMQTPIVLQFAFWNLRPQAVLNLSLHVFNEHGIMAFNTTSLRETSWDGRPFPDGLFESSCVVPSGLLNSGVYRVDLLIVRDRATILYSHSDALVFEVEDSAEERDGWYGKWPGVVHPTLQWSTQLVQRAHRAYPATGYVQAVR